VPTVAGSELKVSRPEVEILDELETPILVRNELCWQPNMDTRIKSEIKT